MKCDKCKEDFPENSWVSGEIYKAIDVHHNPPEFMMEEWKGEFINLCRDCYRELHDRILEIIFKRSNLFKPKKSEYWTWIAIIGNNRIKAKDEVIEFTKRWAQCL